MWDAAFTLCMGGTHLGVNLPGIHPFEVIAAVADANANAGPKNCHLSSRAMNDRNPKLPGGAFFYQNRYVQFAVAIKISLQIGRVDAKGRSYSFPGDPFVRALLTPSGTSRIVPGDGDDSESGCVIAFVFTST